MNDSNERAENSVNPAEPVVTAPADGARWYRKRGILLGVLGIPVALALAATAYLLLNAEPRSFVLHGAIDLKRVGVASDGAGGCRGFRAYNDIGPGTTVTVYDSTGDVVALGALEKGVLVDLACRFEFHVEHVPTGSPGYTVEVGHRGKLTYRAAEVRNSWVRLTLG